MSAIDSNVNVGISNVSQDFEHNAKIVFFYGLGILLLLVAFQLLTIFMRPAAWIAWASMVLYLGFFVLSLKKTPVFFWLFFLFYFGQAAAIISCAYLESGHYITEQAVFASATGATSRLVIYNLVFFLASLVIITPFIRNPAHSVDLSKTISDRSVWTICLVISVLLATLYAGLYVYGVPLFEGIDRFEYWLNHPNPIFRTLGGQIFLLMFLLGILFSCSKRRIYLFLLFGVCIYLILQGGKFSGMFLVGYFFLLPVFITKAVTGEMQFSLKKIGMYTAIIATVILSLLYYHYSEIYNAPESTVVDAIFNRALGLQGHVWWGTDVEVMNRSGLVDVDQLGREFSSFISFSSAEEDVGIKYLMSLIAPPHIANAFLDKGVVFTMGYPAIGLYIFGYVGLVIFQVMVAGIVVPAAVYVYRKLARRQLIRAAVAIKIFIDVYGAFTVGAFYLLFSPKVLMYILVAFAIEGFIFMGNRAIMRQELIKTIK
ncbi:MAG: hypothetical protein KAW61_01735 [candidate division Zixibacteria bacterium]|nr:hypothetical protein [candidate division Zixibacteria bacterium]